MSKVDRNIRRRAGCPSVPKRIETSTWATLMTSQDRAVHPVEKHMTREWPAPTLCSIPRNREPHTKRPLQDQYVCDRWGRQPPSANLSRSFPYEISRADCSPTTVSTRKSHSYNKRNEHQFHDIAGCGLFLLKRNMSVCRIFDWIYSDQIKNLGNKWNLRTKT